MKNMETIKTAVIIVLALVLVFGGSFMASELKNKNTAKVDNEEKKSSTENNTETTTSEETTSEENSDKTVIAIDFTRNFGQHSAIMAGLNKCSGGIIICLDDDGQTKLVKSDDYFSEGYGTPTILIVQKNKIIDKIEGLSTKDNIVSLFKKHDFIKE